MVTNSLGDDWCRHAVLREMEWCTFVGRERREERRCDYEGDQHHEAEGVHVEDCVGSG